LEDLEREYMTEFHLILRDYIRDYALPAMLARGWAWQPAKSSDWHGERGPDYHIDQSLRTHILNGVYAMTRVLQYLVTHGYYSLSEEAFKRFLVLYTLHDCYKDRGIGSTRGGAGTFDIPLVEIKTLLEEMHLHNFITITAEDVRAALVSFRSQKIADFSATTPGTLPLLTLVHLADALASQQSARDYHTAQHSLEKIIHHGKESVVALTEQRMFSRAGVTLPPAVPQHSISFHFHDFDDFRGLSTLLWHKAAEQALGRYGLYPVLFFADCRMQGKDGSYAFLLRRMFHISWG
jgi:CRISPR type I-D-associated protein Csc3/Cas10d